MSLSTTKRNYATQNSLLLAKLMDYYKNVDRLETMLGIINSDQSKQAPGEMRISLRIIDWFVTNYSKKYDTCYILPGTEDKRFKVYLDYKLKLRAYSKENFDPFCRWTRINIPYKNGLYIETTIGQLNFFRWAIDHSVLNYIEEHYEEIEKDMNTYNSSSSRKKDDGSAATGQKTRRKRKELSISAIKCIKKEDVEIILKFD